MGIATSNIAQYDKGRSMDVWLTNSNVATRSRRALAEGGLESALFSSHYTEEDRETMVEEGQVTTGSDVTIQGEVEQSTVTSNSTV